MYKYKIIEDNKEDYTAIKVKKSGITAEFTIAQMMNEEVEIAKKIEEFKGNLALHEIAAQKIEHKYPFVKNLSVEEQYAVYEYFTAKSGQTGFQNRLKQYQEALDGSVKEREEIISTLEIDTKNGK